MRLSTSLIFVFLLIFSLGFSQLPLAPNVTDEKGKRQGDWVIYYDLDWEEISDTSIVEFYRKISYVNDKPKGLVTDYYATGIKQWEGELISDRPDFSNGWVKYFYDNGNVEMEGMMKKNKNFGEWKNYTYLGKFSHKSIYKNGIDKKYDLKIRNAEMYFENKKLKKAERTINKMVDKFRKIESHDKNNLIADYLFLIGMQYWDNNINLDTSLYFLSQSLNIYEKVFGKLSFDFEETRHILAMCYSENGNYQKSLELNLENQQLIEKLYGKLSDRYALNLNNLALDYSNLGELEKSKKLNLECLHLWEKLSGKYHSDYAICLNNLALIYNELSDFKNSLSTYNEALKITENLFGKQSEDYALCLANLSLLYDDLGEYNKALDLSNEALDIRKNLFGVNSEDYTNSLGNVAMIYSSLGDYEKSKNLNKICYEIECNIYGKKHPNTVVTLSNLASVYSELGELEEAENLTRECLYIKEELFGKKHPDYALSLGNLAYLYSLQGDFKQSLSINKKVLKLKEESLGKNHLYYLTTLGNIASDYSALGYYEKSLDLNYDVRDISLKLYGENHPNSILSLNNIAQDYYNLGNFKKSLEINKKCLILYENVFGKFHSDYAMSLNNLALNYSSLGQFDKSLESNKLSLSITEKINGKNHLNYFITLNNIAQNYSDLGNHEKSLEVNSRCLKLAENLFGKYHPNYAMSLNNLALNYSEFGNHQKSIELNKKALNLSELIYGKEHPDYSLALYNLAMEYFYNNQFGGSDSLFFKVLKINQKVFFRNYDGLSEIEKEGFISTIKNTLENMMNYSLYRKNVDSISSEILNSYLNLKGILLSSNLNTINHALSTNDKSLLKLYKNWKNNKIELGKYYELSKDEKLKYSNEINGLEAITNRLEKKLSKSSFHFSSKQKKITWVDLKNKLKGDEVFIEILRFNKYYGEEVKDDSVIYVVFIVDSSCSDKPILFEINNKKIESECYNYYSSHTSGRNKQRLDEYSYQNFWSAISEKLKGKKRIYVSSDGVYNKINLNVLYNTETGKYLGEEVDIRLVTSGRDLFKTYPEINEELTAVLVGSPKYDLIEEQVQDDDLLVSRDLQQNWIDSLSRGWSVSSLPGTAIEVSNISNLMSKNNWEVTTYTEEEALEGKVKSVSSPTVLHIATHGYFFEDVDKEKKSPKSIMGIDNKKATQNPLLRSGLLFAGAKNTLNGKPPESGDNGLLTSYEASYMDLRGTELVVLSACNTARGEIKNGEGVYGLQRAIQQAGAKNIIMSMWKVDDKVTQEFMTNFYDLWLSGKTKRNAFYETQMIIKEKYKHPYYWGAFVMIGK